MAESPAIPDDAARSRVRSIITTILLIMITAMIVRDIFVRRWGSATPPASDVTQGLRVPGKSP
jgi:hypothetical protein